LTIRSFVVGRQRDREEEGLMDRQEIRAEVKRLIGKVTSLEPDEIADSATFREDLELDSLAMIEIAVEVGFAYKLKMSEEEMAQLKGIDDAVEMVVTKLANAEHAAT
jgi:acyl carrier protein